MAKKPSSRTKKPSKTSEVASILKPDMSTWRLQLTDTKLKFDDEMKGLWLEAFAEHGRLYQACKDVGISYIVFSQHLTIDPGFAEMVATAKMAYRDTVVGHGMDLAMNGRVRKKYDKDGHLIQEETVYETGILMMEMKRVEPEYRERGEPAGDPGKKGGVIVVPPTVTIEEFLALETERVKTAQHPDEIYTLEGDRE
mgnify:CR=1 FL=1